MNVFHTDVKKKKNMFHIYRVIQKFSDIIWAMDNKWKSHGERVCCKCAFIHAWNNFILGAVHSLLLRSGSLISVCQFFKHVTPPLDSLT